VGAWDLGKEKVENDENHDTEDPITPKEEPDVGNSNKSDRGGRLVGLGRLVRGADIQGAGS